MIRQANAMRILPGWFENFIKRYSIDVDRSIYFRGKKSPPESRRAFLQFTSQSNPGG
jgi:hypothetical protein